MFIDKAKIYVKAGDGGNGIVSFRREKYVPRGGPDGGDGGRGGNVIIKTDPGLKTLLDYKYRQHHKASRGRHGGGNDKNGKKAPDLIIKVPLGTIIKDGETSKIIADLSSENSSIIVVKGGRGGKGNSKFATPTRKAPRFAEKGEPGEEKNIILELKLIADVGLIGLPNVGKSTLLSSTSAANPKIANYHFTTLKPNLGVVRLNEGQSFVMADIPGLIEGASRGEGLGMQFLRHIERTNILIHVVDGGNLEKRDLLNDFALINRELEKYGQKLLEKEQIVAINKMDIVDKKSDYSILKEALIKDGYKVFLISAVTGKGIRDLLYYTYERLIEVKEKNDELKDNITDEKIYKHYEDENDYYIEKTKEIFIIKGKKIERIASMTDLENEESVKRFQRIVDKMGIDDELKKKGIKEGDTVKIKNIEFEYSE